MQKEFKAIIINIIPGNNFIIMEINFYPIGLKFKSNVSVVAIIYILKSFRFYIVEHLLAKI
jgi:hypothetical protein